MFIAAFTYIAFTTNPVYTGIGVGDRVPELEGQIYDGGAWTDFKLEDSLDPLWAEGDGATWFMIEFMDTNCGYCQQQAAEDIPNQQAKWSTTNALTMFVCKKEGKENTASLFFTSNIHHT